MPTGSRAEVSTNTQACQWRPLNFFVDDAVLTAAGVAEVGGYAHEPGAKPLPDLFVV
jgi:hypothetical protein